MSLNYEASKTFFLSLENIDTLIRYAKEEDKNNNENNRKLFLKLSIVLMITKFQVFIETILEEFLFKIRNGEFCYGKLSSFARLNSLKINVDKNHVDQNLNNPSKYNDKLLETITKNIHSMKKHCDCLESILEEFEINTKFPLGKTGTIELIDLFRQLDGRNIFENKIDLNTLDSLLNLRHNIIHQDATPALTETVATGYQLYVKNVCQFIDKYLNGYLLDINKTT